jgi:hypothetical protein
VVAIAWIERANSVGIWVHLGLFKQCRSITSIKQWGRIAENGQVVSTVNAASMSNDRVAARIGAYYAGHC